MIKQRPSNERGHFDFGWLDTFHTFSFGEYHDPAWVHFKSLRVINEDRVAPGRGFPSHPHRDMEIITFVISGELKHTDSMGHSATIRPGEVQKFSAGSGVLHSEENPSAVNPVHLLQIWIIPERKGITPAYEQVTPELTQGALTLIGSPDPLPNQVSIHQDARLYFGRLSSGDTVEHIEAPGRGTWIQLISGTAMVNGAELRAGDGLGSKETGKLTITAPSPADLLLFDLG